jgi:hypothetical protein
VQIEHELLEVVVVVQLHRRFEGWVGPVVMEEVVGGDLVLTFDAVAAAADVER